MDDHLKITHNWEEKWHLLNYTPKKIINCKKTNFSSSAEDIFCNCKIKMKFQDWDSSEIFSLVPDFFATVVNNKTSSLWK